MTHSYPQKYIGYSFAPEVKSLIKLTLAFTAAVGNRETDKADNLVLSPYNALTCLSMVAKGADGRTREEMAQALFGTDAATLNDQISKLAALNAQIIDANKDSVTLKTANGVWINKDQAPLSPTYAAELKRDFGAEIGNDRFDDAAVARINQWASDSTNKLVTKILEDLSPDDYAILASVLYFKGDWTSKFDKALTKDKAFGLDGGAVQATPTMRKEVKEEGVVRYQDGADYEAAALTYGKKDEGAGIYPTMRLVLVPPKDAAVSARDWLAAQADGNIPAWLEPAAFESAVGSLELPRIETQNKYDLVKPLQDMGVRKAFGRGAEFGPMTDGKADLFVSEVTQDTVFKTNEEGSEAAAVTMARMSLECARPDPAQIDLKFDRSFVLALQDVKTGAVLFVGAVNKPNKEMKPAPKI